MRIYFDKENFRKEFIVGFKEEDLPLWLMPFALIMGFFFFLGQWKIQFGEEK